MNTKHTPETENKMLLADQILMSDGTVNFSKDKKTFVIKLQDEESAKILFKSLKGTASLILDGRTQDYFISNDEGGMIRNFETIIASK